MEVFLNITPYDTAKGVHQRLWYARPGMKAVVWEMKRKPTNVYHLFYSLGTQR